MISGEFPKYFLVWQPTARNDTKRIDGKYTEKVNHRAARHDPRNYGQLEPEVIPEKL